MKEHRGIAASPGIAIGPVFNYKKTDVHALICRDRTEDSEPEIQLLEAAMEKARCDIERLIELMEEKERYAEVAVFSVQLEFMDDPSYGGEIRRLVFEESYSAGHAIEHITKGLSAEFAEIKDDYFRARIADIQDITSRLLAAVFNVEDLGLADIREPSIVVADDLTPTDTAHLVAGTTLAIVTRLGSATSHSAILSRGLGIPAVVGLGKVDFENGCAVVVDGKTGLVMKNPDEELRAEYLLKAEKYQQQQRELIVHAKQPARSRDGKRINVTANIGSSGDVQHALENGADGVGLLRTEFLFMEQESLPGESEQYEQYRQIFKKFEDNPVVVRTLDIGGDKQLPGLDLHEEQNPFLGERAIRLAMSNRDKLLYPQLRAILRAGAGMDLRIMFPMVSQLGEFLELKAIIEALKADLMNEGIEYNYSPQLGIMIETPAAAVTADLFAAHVDFFSIGTNDLIQYTMAADRTNERVANLADYFQPSVIRLVDTVIQAAHAQKKWVGMCGEMAGDPLAVQLLLSLGLDEFSMAPLVIPDIKNRIRKLSVEEMQQMRNRIISAASPNELKNLLRTIVK